jgi:hypothetical protein
MPKACPRRRPTSSGERLLSRFSSPRRLRHPENAPEVAKLIEMCAKAKHDKLDAVMIHHPQVLGDNYDEMVESMNRIADAGLMIHILPRGEREKANALS